MHGRFQLIRSFFGRDVSRFNRRSIGRGLVCLGLLVLMFCFLFPTASSGAVTFDGPPLAYMDTVPGLQSIRTENRPPFFAGEEMKLRVTYLGLTAGYIDLAVDGGSIGQRRLYRLNLDAETGGFVEYLYSLRDQFVSYFDRQGLFSWGYDYHQRHNGKRKTRTVRYYHRAGFFRENGKRKGSIDPYTQDLLSTIYYIRSLNLDDSDTLSFSLQTGDESYDVKLDVRENARVATKVGWMDAYELKPILTNSQQKGEAQDHVESISGIRIWFSTDKRKIPLKISFPATFGHLDAFLESYEGRGESPVASDF